MIEGHDYTICTSGSGGRARIYALIAVITAFLTPLTQHGLLVPLRWYWWDDWDVAECALFFGGFTALVLFGLQITAFGQCPWRTQVGGWMFRAVGLPAPLDLSGEYRGPIELHATTDPEVVFHTSYHMRIVQTWEQISLLIERESEAGGLVSVHSDMASIRIEMLERVITLWFMYTFGENLPRREGAGMMARQSTGAATSEFRREREAWGVQGHFFDDVGRSGQVHVSRDLPGAFDPHRRACMDHRLGDQSGRTTREGP